jgi:hypothetical protein
MLEMNAAGEGGVFGDGESFGHGGSFGNSDFYATGSAIVPKVLGTYTRKGKIKTKKKRKKRKKRK